MKPAWDRLIEEFNPTSKGGLVADVDCTAGGKALCSRIGVQGYPTIKWGDPNSLQDYEGGRDFDALLEFAKENLKPQCSPGNQDPCTDEQKAEIAKLKELGAAELETQIEAKEQALKDAEQTFQDALAKLNERYSELVKEKDDTIKEVKDSGLSLMKSVKAFLGADDAGGDAADAGDDAGEDEAPAPADEGEDAEKAEL